MARLARENLEEALSELGRLLEFTREAATATECGDDNGNRSLNTVAPSGADRSKEEPQRFARVMVRKE